MQRPGRTYYHRRCGWASSFIPLTAAPMYHHHPHHHHHHHHIRCVSCRPASYTRQDKTREIFFNHLVAHPVHVEDPLRTNNSVTSISLWDLLGQRYMSLRPLVSDSCRAEASRHGADRRSTKLVYLSRFRPQSRNH